MRCGNCKHDHPSVADVQACYENAGKIKVSDKFTDDGLQPVTQGPMWPASDAQIKYALGLQDERIMPDNWLMYDEKTLRRLERDEVSGIIQSLKGLARKEGHKGKQYTMPSGRYALAVEYADNEWKFYQVDKPDKGRWAGYTFIKMLVGAPGQYRKVDMSQQERSRVLGLIEDDPKKAMLDYGLQSGVCGRCSSPLTDPESLARGIGPICAGKDGWF